MIKAVLFDMDGVLIDSEPVYSQRKIDFFSQYGYHFTKERMNSFAGLDLDVIMQKLFPEKSDAELEKIIDVYKQFSETYHFPYDEILNAGVKETLRSLKQQHIKTAIVSTSPKKSINDMIRICGLENMFDLIVSGEDYPKSKPEPAVYNAARDALGYEADEYLVVEDSDTGIAAAKGSGLSVAAIRAAQYGFHQDQADMLIDTVDQVLDIIKKINKE